MLEQVARHGGFALELTCTGDLEIDEHHTVEDCALALGQALRKRSATSAASAASASCCRWTRPRRRSRSIFRAAPTLSSRASSAASSVGGLPTELVPHFFRSLADSLLAAVHVQVTGENTHHMVEACFKGTGRALRQAMRVEGTRTAEQQGRAVSRLHVTDVAIIANGGANIASLRFALDRLGASSQLTADAASCARAARHPARRRRRGGCHGAPARARAGRRDPGADAARARHLPRHAVAVRWQRGRRHALPGHLPGRVARFPIGRAVRCRTWAGTSCVPQRASPLLRGLADGAYVYFVHSYAAPVGPWTDAATDYGGEFSALVRRAQFSRRAVSSRALGACRAQRLLANFLELALTCSSIPAIDLRGGRCVRLLQGRFDAETVYGNDPGAILGALPRPGRALRARRRPRRRARRLTGQPVGNRQPGAERSQTLPSQVGGGVRSREVAAELLGTRGRNASWSAAWP